MARLLRALHQRQKVLRPLLAKRIHQQPRRILHAAVHHVLLRLQHLVELFDHLERDVRRNILQVRNLLSQALDIRLREVLNDLLAQLVAHRDHQDRRLANAWTAQPSAAFASRRRAPGP